MARKKETDYSVSSIRLPDRMWKILRQLASQGYRSLNNQILKIFEDWLVERGLLENSERTKID